MLPTRNLHVLSAAFIFSLLQFFFLLSLSNPDETAALLDFKSKSDPLNSLSSWAAGSGPCSGSWIGVSCDPKTGRVTKLVLENLNLTGSTSPLGRLVHLGVLSLNRNNLLSPIDLSAWPHLNHLYLAHNRFAGPLPAGISSLHRLRRLDLSHNQFSGEIPFTELTQLPRLLTLRLESNSFSGALNYAGKFDPGSISDFNVSDNNLWGEIPPSLSKFGAASFSGNDLLCGDPLPLKCLHPMPGNVTVRSRKASGRSGAVLAISIVGGVVALLVMGTTATWCWRTRRRTRRNGGAHKKTGNGHGYASKHYGPGELKRTKTNSGAQWAHNGPRESEGMVVLEGCPRGVGKVGDLLKASAEMLGKGSVGTTFKVVVGGGDGGDTVAVKRIKEKRNGGKEIDLLLRQIGGLRHPNIVSLRAFHNSNSEMLLVYDFMGGGSLHFALHGNRGPGRTPVAWAARLKLAAGSADGLAFLHGSSKAKLFHGNLTSSNILVDEMGNARIADIGLHQLMTSPVSSCPAYQAPELRLSGNKSPRKFNQKCDVYSFGVVLLEILTGRMAAEEGEVGLVEWAKVAVVKRECRTWEVMDFEMVGDKEMEKEMWALLEVGLLCVAQSAKDRPTMGMVHRMIEDIRRKGSREDGAKSILDGLTSDYSSSSRSESTS